MSAWAIRAATAADRASILRLWRAAGSVPTATDSAGGLGRLLQHDSGCLLLAEAGDEVIGSLIAAWDGWRGSFYRLAVHPAWRRQGLGTALVRAGEDRLSRLGAVRLTAIVAADGSAALELWAAAGYRRQEDRTRFVRELSDRASTSS
jgi:ribosomal protein S18 acetylase RimI-like enzyme